MRASNHGHHRSSTSVRLARPAHRASPSAVGSMDVENITNKENPALSSAKPLTGADFNAKPLRTSSSLRSLRSLVHMRRSSTLGSLPIISQPTLDDSSAEKVRNKVKHSPSMLSINQISGEHELHSAQHRRVVDGILAYTVTRAVVPEETARAHPHDVQIDLTRTPPPQALYRLQLQESLARAPRSEGFAGFRNVHLTCAANDDDLNRLQLMLSYNHSGTLLSRFAFADAMEPITVLVKVCQILAHAEQDLQFEHRNLHADSIVVERDLRTGEIANVQLIDCHLARFRDPGSGVVYYTPLDRSEFYAPRLPVLAYMRVKVKNPQTFVPATNVLWLVYLAKYLNSRHPSAALRRAEEVLSPSWGGLRKAPKSAEEAFDRLVRKL